MLLQVIIYALVTGTEALLIALALYMVHRVSNVINLALGGIASLGAYSFYLFFTLWEWPLVLSILAGLVVVGLFGLLSYLLSESFTQKQEYLLALLVSFAFGLGLEATLAIGFGADGKSILPGILPVFASGNYQITLPGALVLGIGAILVALAALSYYKTPIGKLIRAVSENYSAAVSLGVNASRLRLWAYITAALVAGIVGTLVGFDTALTPTMGFNLIIIAFIVLLVGGVSDLRGTIIAAYVVALIPELIIGLGASVSANWRMALVFLIAAVLLMIRPNGILHTKQRVH